MTHFHQYYNINCYRSSNKYSERAIFTGNCLTRSYLSVSAQDSPRYTHISLLNVRSDNTKTYFAERELCKRIWTSPSGMDPEKGNKGRI